MLLRLRESQTLGHDNGLKDLCSSFPLHSCIDMQDLLENGMTSSYTDERACTARSLAQLGITDSDQVIPVLLHALETDKSPIVRFEASKALINLGIKILIFD